MVAPQDVQLPDKTCSFLRLRFSCGLVLTTAVAVVLFRYDGVYTGKKELGGCGGGQATISQEPATTEEQLTTVEGPWQALTYQWSTAESKFDVQNADAPTTR